MTQYQIEEPVSHVEGTDFFHKSYSIEPGVRWEYRFNVDFENQQPNPLKPRRAPSEDGAVSELATSGFEYAAYLRPYEGRQPGSIETFTHASEILGNEREIDVYLPHGYDGGRGLTRCWSSRTGSRGSAWPTCRTRWTTWSGTAWRR